MSGYYISGNLYIVARDVLRPGIKHLGTYTLWPEMCYVWVLHIWEPIHCGPRCVMSGYYISGNLYIMARDVLCLGITYLGTHTLWPEMCYVWALHIWEPIHSGPRCVMSGYYISGNLNFVSRDVLCLGITHLGTHTLWPEMCYVWVLHIWEPIHSGPRCVMSWYYISGNLYIVARDVLCLGITYLGTYTLWPEMCYVLVLHIWEPIHCGPRCVMSGHYISGNPYILARDVLCLGITYLGT